MLCRIQIQRAWVKIQRNILFLLYKYKEHGYKYKLTDFSTFKLRRASPVQASAQAWNSASLAAKETQSACLLPKKYKYVSNTQIRRQEIKKYHERDPECLPATQEIQIFVQYINTATTIHKFNYQQMLKLKYKKLKAILNS